MTARARKGSVRVTGHQQEPQAIAISYRCPSCGGAAVRLPDDPPPGDCPKCHVPLEARPVYKVPGCPRCGRFVGVLAVTLSGRFTICVHCASDGWAVRLV